MTAEADAVLEAEARRCRAISEQDWIALAGLLADDLTHTHATGVTQDKATYLDHVARNPRRTGRGALSVRLFGDTAVTQGPQINYVERDGQEVEQSIETIQVWVRRDGEWQMVAFAASGQR